MNKPKGVKVNSKVEFFDGRVTFKKLVKEHNDFGKMMDIILDAMVNFGIRKIEIDV